MSQVQRRNLKAEFHKMAYVELFDSSLGFCPVSEKSVNDTLYHFVMVAPQTVRAEWHNKKWEPCSAAKLNVGEAICWALKVLSHELTEGFFKEFYLPKVDFRHDIHKWIEITHGYGNPHAQPHMVLGERLEVKINGISVKVGNDGMLHFGALQFTWRNACAIARFILGDVLARNYAKGKEGKGYFAGLKMPTDVSIQVEIAQTGVIPPNAPTKGQRLYPVGFAQAGSVVLCRCEQGFKLIILESTDIAYDGYGPYVLDSGANTPIYFTSIREVVTTFVDLLLSSKEPRDLLPSLVPAELSQPSSWICPVGLQINPVQVANRRMLEGLFHPEPIVFLGLLGLIDNDGNPDYVALEEELEDGVVIQMVEGLGYTFVHEKSGFNAVFSLKTLKKLVCFLLSDRIVYGDRQEGAESFRLEQNSNPWLITALKLEECGSSLEDGSEVAEEETGAEEEEVVPETTARGDLATVEAVVIAPVVRDKKAQVGELVAQFRAGLKKKVEELVATAPTG